MAKRGGWEPLHGPATVIEINLTRTEASSLADIGLYGKAGEILRAFCRFEFEFAVQGDGFKRTFSCTPHFGVDRLLQNRRTPRGRQ